MDKKALKEKLSQLIELSQEAYSVNSGQFDGESILGEMFSSDLDKFQDSLDDAIYYLRKLDKMT